MTAMGTRKRVVIARSKEGNQELAGRLVELGIDAFGVETIVFEEPSDWSEVDDAIRSTDRYDWVAFTSPRAVGHFLARLSNLGFDARSHFPHLAAVGSKTASGLEKAGFRVDFVPERYLTSALAEGLPSGFGKRVLLLRADIGDRALSVALVRRGFEVTDLAIYYTRIVPGNVDPRELGDPTLVVFASPSEVRGFKSRVRPELFRGIAEKAIAVCIGPVTAKEAKAAGFRAVDTPSQHTLDALLEKVREDAYHV